MTAVQLWRGVEQAPPGWGHCVVTIGVFDGVHRGHQAILRRAVEHAGAAGLPAVLLTFDPHPSEVVRPGSAPAVLTTLRHKAELVAALGIDVLCVLRFTLEFSRLAPDEFVHAVLVEHLHASAVVVGQNFRFGHRAAGEVATLAELGRRFGFATESVPLVRKGELTFSSTFVRSCVDAGDVESAADVLGRPHRVEGVVVRGDRRGRELGFPTANVEPTPRAAVPGDGIYAGWLLRGADRWPAAVSIGTNPTFAGRERRVEAYAIDADVDLYGDHVGVEFVARLRDVERYGSVGAAVTQISRDVEAARAALR